VRGTDPEQNAGAVARKLAARRGFGGGHRMLAAAQIPLLPEERDDPERRRRLVERLIQRFLRATGAPNGNGQRLCSE